MKEINFTLKLASPWDAGNSMEQMKAFQDIISASVKKLQDFLALLPPAPPGYKWTWDVKRDEDVITLHNFRLVKA